MSVARPKCVRRTRSSTDSYEAVLVFTDNVTARAAFSTHYNPEEVSSAAALLSFEGNRIIGSFGRAGTRVDSHRSSRRWRYNPHGGAGLREDEHLRTHNT